MPFPLNLRSTEDHGHYLQNEAVVNQYSLYSPLDALSKGEGPARRFVVLPETQGTISGHENGSSPSRIHAWARAASKTR
jgi:hypothetical protein